MRLRVFSLVLTIGAVLASDYRVTLGISQTDGQIGLGYDPGRILPSAGDTITFSWAIPPYIRVPTTGSYSATQGDPNSPCTPLAGGFDTGAKTSAAENTGNAPTVVYTVKDTQPLYFYSSVGDQCKKGMVLGVNTPATGAGSIEAYAAAAASGSTAAPPPGSSSPSSSPANSPSSAPADSSSAPANSPSASTTVGSTSGSASGTSASPSTTGKSSATPMGASTYEILGAVVIACIVGYMSDVAMC